MILLDIIILWIHIFSAVLFVGGSFFIWAVVWPASHKITDDEKERTRIVGKIGKQFAYFTHITLGLLILTGLYNMTWYLPSSSDLTITTGGQILLAKIILVVVMIVMMYANNMYHGKKIMRLAKEGRLDEVKRIRKITHLVSFTTLGLMVVITILATSLQFY